MKVYRDDDGKYYSRNASYTHKQIMDFRNSGLNVIIIYGIDSI